MSKINGDKARDAKRGRRKASARVKNQALRDLYVLPLKTTLTPKIAPKKAAKPAPAAKS
jgi:hypothetical protein